jgi:hypothetical protein
MNEQDQRVLSYYGREALGVIESEPLAGLRLSAFRAARERLLRAGLLVRDDRGRYVPAA